MPATPDIRDLQPALDRLIQDGTLDRRQAAKVPDAVAPLLVDGRVDDDGDSTAVLYLCLGILVVAVPAYVFWRGSALVLAAYAGGFILTLWIIDQQVSPSWEAKDGLIGLLVYGLVVAGIGWPLPERDL